MLENQKKIDNLFNDFLHDYEEEVPSFVWNNLKKELKTKKRQHVLYYIKAVAASIALLITFGLGYFVSDLNLNKNNKAKILQQDLNQLFFQGKSRPSGDSLEIVETDKFPDESVGNKQKEDLYKYAIALKESELMFQIANYEKIRIYDTNQLYRKYQYINKIFASNNYENKANLNLVSNNLSERKSNQLLTDTLLLEKENLHEGGFLLKNENKKLSAWSFGTKFSPVISMGDNASQESVNVNNDGIKSAVRSDQPDVNSEEKPLTSYSGGFNVNYHLSRRFSIQSGIYYSQKKQGSDNLIGSQDNEFGGDDLTVYTPAGTRSIDPIDNGSVLRSSYSTTYYTLNANFISNAEYIELPLIIRYKLIDQKVSLDVMSGFSTNFLVNNSSFILSEDQKLWSGENEDINSILYGATVGLGVNYNFYQNFSINLEPTFKYSILPENSVFRKYPYSFAVFAGFSYRFK
ncbi:MAG: outer membrane beta-barrel protein [Bacteroidota bacterium]